MRVYKPLLATMLVTFSLIGGKTVCATDFRLASVNGLLGYKEGQVLVGDAKGGRDQQWRLSLITGFTGNAWHPNFINYFGKLDLSYLSEELDIVQTQESTIAGDNRRRTRSQTESLTLSGRFHMSVLPASKYPFTLDWNRRTTDADTTRLFGRSDLPSSVRFDRESTTLRLEQQYKLSKTTAYELRYSEDESLVNNVLAGESRRVELNGNIWDNPSGVGSRYKFDLSQADSSGQSRGDETLINGSFGHIYRGDDLTSTFGVTHSEAEASGFVIGGSLTATQTDSSSDSVRWGLGLVNGSWYDGLNLSLAHGEVSVETAVSGVQVVTDNVNIWLSNRIDAGLISTNLEGFQATSSVRDLVTASITEAQTEHVSLGTDFSSDRYDFGPLQYGWQGGIDTQQNRSNGVTSQAHNLNVGHDFQFDHAAEQGVTETTRFYQAASLGRVGGDERGVVDHGLSWRQSRGFSTYRRSRSASIDLGSENKADLFFSDRLLIQLQTNWSGNNKSRSWGQDAYFNYALTTSKNRAQPLIPQADRQQTIATLGYRGNINVTVDYYRAFKTSFSHVYTNTHDRDLVFDNIATVNVGSIRRSSILARVTSLSLDYADRKLFGARNLVYSVELRGSLTKDIFTSADMVSWTGPARQVENQIEFYFSNKIDYRFAMMSAFANIDYLRNEAQVEGVVRVGFERRF